MLYCIRVIGDEMNPPNGSTGDVLLRTAERLTAVFEQYPPDRYHEGVLMVLQDTATSIANMTGSEQARMVSALRRAANLTGVKSKE
jgi:hypothetical protein